MDEAEELFADAERIEQGQWGEDVSAKLKLKYVGDAEQDSSDPLTSGDTTSSQIQEVLSNAPG
eukprot:15458400-Alexandrium_andersonii.AAC.1